MITLNETSYKNIAAMLLEKIEGTSLFNGTIEYDTDEFYSTLTCTLIICRDSDQDKILSILPIWWEYALYMSDGEHLNDFSWLEFNEFLVNEQKI